jgi:uncharacterized membrane protein
MGGVGEGLAALHLDVARRMRCAAVSCILVELASTALNVYMLHSVICVALHSMQQRYLFTSWLLDRCLYWTRTVRGGMTMLPN